MTRGVNLQMVHPVHIGIRRFLNGGSGWSPLRQRQRGPPPPPPTPPPPRPRPLLWPPLPPPLLPLPAASRIQRRVPVTGDLNASQPRLCPPIHRWQLDSMHRNLTSPQSRLQATTHRKRLRHRSSAFLTFSQREVAATPARPETHCLRSRHHPPARHELRLKNARETLGCGRWRQELMPR